MRLKIVLATMIQNPKRKENVESNSLDIPILKQQTPTKEKKRQKNKFPNAPSFGPIIPFGDDLTWLLVFPLEVLEPV
jgi:hypothetical protein